MPKVSVVVPIYNVEAYVRDCLESIRVQTCDDIEVLCVIDGSTDGSLEIAQRFAADDGRFHVLEKENGGLSSARNHGIAHATGDYLLFVDADDRIEPFCCERLVAAFREHAANVVVFGATVLPAEENTPWFDRALSPELKVCGAFDPDFMFADYTTPFAWRCAVRREALAESGVRFDEGIPFGEDVVFQFALYPRMTRLVSIPDKLYCYRLKRAGSLMDDWADGMRHFQVHYDMVSRVLSDWKALGIIGLAPDRLLAWAGENLLYGADRLPKEQREGYFRQAESLVSECFGSQELPSPAVELRCACRGDGKLYLLYSVESLTPFFTLDCLGMCDGRQVPVGAYPLSDDRQACSQEWVLEVPLLSAGSMSVVLRPNGWAYEQVGTTIDFSIAKWLSRMNYRLQPGRCAAIRDIERRFTQGRYQVFTQARFPDDAYAVWRFNVEWAGAADALPQLDVLDAAGAPLDASCYILEVQPASTEEGATNKAFASVKIWGDIDHFVVWATDPAGNVASGFAAIDPDMVQFYICAADDLMLNAGDDDGAYRAWFAQHRQALENASEPVVSPEGACPSFSVVVFGDDASDGLSATLESLSSQSYAPREIIVTGSVESETALSASSVGEALGQATGDFIAFVSQGDLLERHALREYARAVARAAQEGNPAEVLYCDEDVVDRDGAFGQPLFKSALNLDLLYCGNWVGNCLAVRKDLLASMKLPKAIRSGVWLYDCALRAYELGASFCYVPYVLHHARVSPFLHGASQAECEALAVHFTRRGIDARVEARPQKHGMRVHYAVPRPHPLVSIVIPSKDHIDLLDACVRSIVQKSTYDAYEIIVVENNSVEEATFAYYGRIQQEFSQVKVVHWPEGFNYSKIVNFGATHAKGDYLMFLNNDTDVISPSFIEEMLGMLQRPEVGVVGAKLLFQDDLVQHAGMEVAVWNAVVHVNQNCSVDDGGYLDRSSLTGEFSSVTGACQMMRREVYEEMGGYNEDFAVGFNDVDFCLSVQEAGYYAVFTPYALLHHREFASRGREVGGAQLERWKHERELFEQRWPGIFEDGDPYTSPNLMRDNTYYRLDFWPEQEELRAGNKIVRLVNRIRGIISVR